MSAPSLINVTPLKKFAERLPYNFILRYLLENEKSELSVYEFLAKAEIWLKVLRLELARGGIED